MSKMQWLQTIWDQILVLFVSEALEGIEITDFRIM